MTKYEWHLPIWKIRFSKDMETLATGLKRIKDLCDEAGCKVEFRTEKDDFVVAFYRNLRDEWNNLGGNTTQGTTQGTTQATQTSNRRELSELELKILDVIKGNSRISQSDISKETGIDVNTVKYYVKRLKEKNVIVREGTSQNGCWKIVG